MKAAHLAQRPGFPLLTGAALEGFRYLQLPRWLLARPEYRRLTPEAKLVYTLLLNRFQLSQSSGWANEAGEIFLIYPRAELAEELGVTRHRAGAAVRELVSARLIWERRCGQGAANQIYLSASPWQKEPGSGQSAEEAALGRPAAEAPNQPAEKEDPDQSAVPETSGQPAEKAPWQPAAAEGEMPVIQKAESNPSRGTISNPLDGRKPSTIQKEKRLPEGFIPKSGLLWRGCPPGTADGTAELEEILAKCHLELFEPEAACAFEGAIERLYYSRDLRIGQVVLPGDRVRARLRRLDSVILETARSKLLQAPDRPVRDSTAYIMRVVFNAITESGGDLLVDPYLNSLRVP